MGPGDRDFLTGRAFKAITSASVVVGYSKYLDLIADLIQDKTVLRSGMKKEVERARAALDYALQGQTVAVVSSGDPGVYGMAGIVLEIAKDQVRVEVIPGVTAATAAAAVLGAPIVHDFAVISLSDLLTPMEKIIKRLEAAARGDFVVIIYNPRSKGRPDHIIKARDILLTYKDPQTPVGIVRNAMRGKEDKMITTLKDMPIESIDMQTIVVIGNTETRIEQGRLITPRGYHI